MLGVRKKKIIQNLIDMLELDSSELVRSTVLKALTNLAPNNPKVLQAFNNLEKSSKIYKYFYFKIFLLIFQFIFLII